MVTDARDGASGTIDNVPVMGVWWGGQGSFDRALSPKFTQNRVFSLKIASTLHDFDKLLRAREGPGPLFPLNLLVLS